MVDWHGLKELFSRSHTFMLLEELVAVFGRPAGKKLDFSVMSQLQEAFDHLSEVFEQDLRIGEENELAAYCRDKQGLVLKNAVAYLCHERGLEGTFLHKGLLLDNLSEWKAW